MLDWCSFYCRTRRYHNLLDRMTIETLLIAVAVVILTALLARRVLYIKLMSKIPGPKAYPFVGGLLPYVMMHKAERFLTFTRMTRNYDGILLFWLGPRPEVHIIHPTYLEKILTSTTDVQKAFFYEFLHPWLGQGLLTSTGERWHKHRKLITPAFHFKILETFSETFVDKANVLVSVLQDHVDGGGINIYPYITNCALDIICETAMGASINAQQGGQEDYVKAVYEVSDITIKRMIYPWLQSDFIFKHTSIGKNFYKQLEILHGFTRKVIKERKELRKNSSVKAEEESAENVYYRKKKTAFLDLLLDASEDGKILSDLELREEVDTFMFEGHDTTSAAISWALLLLGNHSDIQDKVYAELNEIIGNSDRNFSHQDLPQMKYLEMVIKETLRMFPSVAMIGRTLTEDITLGGYLIPKGTGINLHIAAAQRLPEFYPDPDTFDPDNFLPDKMQRRHPFSYIPFSGGSRNCIGQKFALMELKIVLSTILYNYKVEALERIEDIRILSDVIIRPEHGVLLKITRR